MNIDAIRHELLEATDDWMKTRRKIATIAALTAAEFGVLGLRQYGVIRRLPDIPLRYFDANAVTTSRAAYPLGVPDSVLAIIGAAGLIGLATAQGTARSGRSNIFDLALAAGVLCGGAGSVIYLGEMVRQRRVCVYCIAGSAGFLSLIPLAGRALRRLWRAIR